PAAPGEASARAGSDTARARASLGETGHGDADRPRSGCPAVAGVALCLAEQVVLARTDQRATTASRLLLGRRGRARYLETAYQDGGDARCFAHREPRGAGNLVGDRDDRHRQLVAREVARATQILERAEAGATERELDLTLAPGSAEGVGDHDREVHAEPSA